MQNNRSLLAADEGANPLKDLTHANLNEPIKQYNANAVKLVQNVSDFAQALGGALECHGQNVIRLVDDFRGRSSETRADAGSMRRLWDSLLRQVEADATAHLELASMLQQQFARPALEGCFHRKVQHRKIFAHREGYEQVVSKQEEKLQRARVEYKRAYGAVLAPYPADQEGELMRAYYEAHNAYVLQLRATNAIAERYQFQCLPGLLAEVAEVYEELCGLTCGCVAGISDSAGERLAEQARRYQALGKELKSVNPQSDLQILARSLANVAQPRKPPRRLFVPPTPPEQASSERLQSMPALRDVLVSTGSSGLSIVEEDLSIEADRLAQEIAHLQDALDTLNRMQRKSAEGNLYTKVAELQEDISMKRFDLGVAQLHLAAVHAQKELFGGSAPDVAPPDGAGNRKMSNGSTGSTKHKWLKAFKSLKTTPTTPPPNDKKNPEAEAGGHQWREYTYRKITPCDACGQVLRGHARQGFRCRNCKANAHTDCMSAVQPANCPSLLPKRTPGIPLLRRQKSSAPPQEETPLAEHNVDAIYQVLKQAGEIRGNSTNSPPTPPTADHPPSGAAPASSSARTSNTSSQPCPSSTSGRARPSAGDANNNNNNSSSSGGSSALTSPTTPNQQSASSSAKQQQRQRTGTISDALTSLTALNQHTSSAKQQQQRQRPISGSTLASLAAADQARQSRQRPSAIGGALASLAAARQSRQRPTSLSGSLASLTAERSRQPRSGTNDDTSTSPNTLNQHTSERQSRQRPSTLSGSLASLAADSQHSAVRQSRPNINNTLTSPAALNQHTLERQTRQRPSTLSGSLASLAADSQHSSARQSRPNINSTLTSPAALNQHSSRQPHHQRPCTISDADDNYFPPAVNQRSSSSQRSSCYVPPTPPHRSSSSAQNSPSRGYYVPFETQNRPQRPKSIHSSTMIIHYSSQPQLYSPQRPKSLASTPVNFNLRSLMPADYEPPPPLPPRSPIRHTRCPNR